MILKRDKLKLNRYGKSKYILRRFISVELFVGSITFVLGTVVFLLLLLKLRLNLKTTLLYCCLQLVLAVSLSTIFFMFWRFNFDIMIGFLYLPGVLSEVFIMLLFYFILKQRTNN